MGNTPSGNILSRHIFEWTAQSCYMAEKLKWFVTTHQWRPAFDLLLQANTGNAWVRDYGGHYAVTHSPKSTLEPIRINKLLVLLGHKKNILM